MLLFVFHASITQFRTTWFVLSVLTELLTMLVMRSAQPFFTTRPGRYLLWSSLVLGIATLALPFVPLATALGLTPLSPALLGLVAGLCVVYVAAFEAAKHLFYRFVSF
jgi:Mg2+-importing ATPase